MKKGCLVSNIDTQKQKIRPTKEYTAQDADMMNYTIGDEKTVRLYVQLN